MNQDYITPDPWSLIEQGFNTQTGRSLQKVYLV